MKILLVAKRYHPTIGGIQRAVAQLAKALQETGYEPEVLTLNRADGESWPAHELVESIPVWRVPYVGPLRYPLPWLPLKMLRKFDCINIHSSDSLLDGLALSAWNHQRPLILTSHGLFFHTPFAKHLKQFHFRTVTRLSLRSVQEIICDSEQDLNSLAEITIPKKLHLIPNGAPVEMLGQFSPLGRDRHLLLAVGQLTKRKQPWLLLPVLAELVRQQPLTRLVFIGQDGGIQTQVEDQVATLGLQDHVIFTGPVSDSVLFDYLGRGSIFLTASAYEGFGIALAEAIAAGCVPLVSPLPTFRQMLGVDSDGLSIEFENPALVAARIRTIQSMTDQERTTLIKRLRGQVAEFGWKAIAQKTVEVYKSAISQKK